MLGIECTHLEPWASILEMQAFVEVQGEGKEEEMDLHGCISLSKRDSERGIYAILLLPPNIQIFTSCFLFKLFKKPGLSYRFKDWCYQVIYRLFQNKEKKDTFPYHIL